MLGLQHLLLALYFSVHTSQSVGKGHPQKDNSLLSSTDQYVTLVAIY
jgi:hypothetical protein